MARRDYAASKAAYRFLDNDRVNEQKILAEHLLAMRQHFASVDGLILVLHDATEFLCTLTVTQSIGQTRKMASGHSDKSGRQRCIRCAAYSCIRA
ncbi:hypothetical protein A6X21_21755 [Planctopirus hydrillae]|uniref:Transposase Tn5-like N-terminal domain-containing protein n=2 Tax=Planctopirus hydrillae TaxID=1841610 RepID=A0A1C3EFY9_9PLAN|nr:hypothetical protein A6X21_21755 [Planctopirus hydrillae]